MRMRLFSVSQRSSGQLLGLPWLLSLFVQVHCWPVARRPIGAKKGPGIPETDAPNHQTGKAVIVDADNQKIESPQDSTVSKTKAPTPNLSNPTDPGSDPTSPDPYVEVNL